MLAPEEQIPLTDGYREFTSVFEHAVIGMALLSPGGRFIQVNRALCRITGYSETELLSKNIRSITEPADLKNDLEQAQHLLRGDIESCQAEKRYAHKQGHLVRARTSVSLIRDGYGEPLYFLHQIESLSSAAGVIDSLQVSRAQLHTLLSLLPFGVLLTDENRAIRLVNQRFCDMLGIPHPPSDLENIDSTGLIEEYASLLARPEFALNRVNEIINNRRPVQDETLEMADGTPLHRDYMPVFVDDDYRGSLWILRK